MATGKIKYRVLVAGGNSKMYDQLSSILPRKDYEFCYHAQSAAEARRVLDSLTIDLVFLITPLKDEFGKELALDLAEDNYGVLLVVSGDVFDQICYEVEDAGVLTIAKPLSRQALYSSVKLISAMRAKLMKLDKQNHVLQDKVREIRTVNRAKWLLIERHHMTEDDAHHFIEHQAMDLRISSREAAEKIIRSYDN